MAGSERSNAESVLRPDVANYGVVRPPIVYLTAILAGVALHFVRPSPFLAPRSGIAPGSAFLLAAVALFVLATRTFRAAGTPVPGNLPTTAIVRSGPYRFSRNPIYLAFSLLVLGLGLLINELALIATLVLALLVMSLVVIPREERYLERKFGAAYTDYKASVRRWV